MPDRITFHLDESVDPDIARGLRRHGVDSTTTVEAGLRGQSDSAQMEHAQRTGRVLVTHDTDFLRLARHHPGHPGIAFCSKATRTIGEIIRSLILIYEVLTPEDMTGRVEFL